jgi:uncharacterized protein YutE (UPF0331/DUF86 family)
LITAIGGIVDVAQHLASSEHFGAPDSNADAVRILGSRGVIDVDLAGKLALAVGFRNILVHGYAAVDDAIVLQAHCRLPDFTQFVAEVRSWLAVHGS